MIRSGIDQLLVRPWIALIAALAVHTGLWLAAAGDGARLHAALAPR